MPNKKPSRRPSPKRKRTSAATLAFRVGQLESDMVEMKSKMGALGEDLSALKTTIRQVDERSVRGEKVMMSMQGEVHKMAKEQHRASQVLDLVAQKLAIPPIAPLVFAETVAMEEELNLEEGLEDDPESEDLEDRT